MRKLTVCLFILLLVLTAFAALFLAGGTLSAEPSAVTAAAADYPQVFEAVRGVLASRAAPQLFTDSVPDSADGLRLEDVTISLANRGVFDAEWVSVEVEPAPGDIAVYSLTGEGGTVRARSIGTINLKLIASASGGGARTYHIQYYVYGMKRTLTLQL